MIRLLHALGMQTALAADKSKEASRGSVQKTWATTQKNIKGHKIFQKNVKYINKMYAYF